MNTKGLSPWRRFDDERGAVMTEFVILLPVFVMLFVGIVHLNRLQRAVNEAHIEANVQMWAGATDVTLSRPDSEWGNPMKVEQVAPEPDSGCPAERYHECAGFDWNKYKRLNDYGTFGEALSSANFEEVQQWLDREENREEFLDENGEVDLRFYDTVYNADSVWGEYAIEATWDRAHLDGDWEIPAGNPPGAFAAFEKARLDGSKLVGGKLSAFAYGAGTRYGLVIANETTEESSIWGVREFEVEYQTLAPPRPMEMDDEEMFTVGTPKLLMTDSGFDLIPGFEYDFRLGGFEIDTLTE